MSKLSDALSIAHVAVGIGATALIEKNTKRLIRQQIYAGIGMSVLAISISFVQTKGIKNLVKKECGELKSSIRDTILRNTP